MKTPKDKINDYLNASRMKLQKLEYELNEKQKEMERVKGEIWAYENAKDALKEVEP